MSKTHHVGVAVDAELAFDPLVDDWNIEVVNLKGDVSLHGTVPSYPEYVEAETAARRVSRGTAVHNHLEVDLTDANKRSDVALTTGANDALMWGVLVIDARRSLRFPLAQRVRRQPTGNRDARLASTTHASTTAMLVPIKSGAGVRDMQRAQINKRHYAARARRDQDGEWVLPLDPRDPEIIRAKHLQMAARSRLAPPRGQSPT